eukprot:ANDGO_03494.mRNA.1 hypothetical protein
MEESSESGVSYTTGSQQPSPPLSVETALGTLVASEPPKLSVTVVRDEDLHSIVLRSVFAPDPTPVRIRKNLRDFQTLRAHLSEEFRGVCVPPLPAGLAFMALNVGGFGLGSISISGTAASISNSFRGRSASKGGGEDTLSVSATHRFLLRFVQVCADHPVLSKSHTFLRFLGDTRQIVDEQARAIHLYDVLPSPTLVVQHASDSSTTTSTTIIGGAGTQGNEMTTDRSQPQNSQHAVTEETEHPHANYASVVGRAQPIWMEHVIQSASSVCAVLKNLKSEVSHIAQHIRGLDKSLASLRGALRKAHETCDALPPQLDDVLVSTEQSLAVALRPDASVDEVTAVLSERIDFADSYASAFIEMAQSQWLVVSKQPMAKSKHWEGKVAEEWTVVSDWMTREMTVILTDIRSLSRRW